MREGILGLAFHLRDRDDLEAVVIRNLVEEVQMLSTISDNLARELDHYKDAIHRGNFELVVENIALEGGTLREINYVVKSKRTLARQAKKLTK